MKKCLVCQKEMSRKPREGIERFNKRKLCGVECRQRYITKLRHKNFKTKYCKNCKQPIKRRESRLLFCSNECRIMWSVGPNNSNWKGGIKKHGEYLQVLVKGHPFADKHGYVLEHRIVMEEYFKEKENYKYLVEIKGDFYLSPKVKIHHKNHNKKDNRIENLVPMFTQKEHFHFNWCPHCPHCAKSDELLENPKG